jgi:hypothetical protein
LQNALQNSVKAKFAAETLGMERRERRERRV